MALDRSELDAFEQHLRGAGARVREPLNQIVERGGKRIARTARELIQGQITGVYLPHYPKSITSEMTGDMQAEIGPVSARKQGGMGAAIEYGSIKAGPFPHMNPAADIEVPKIADDAARAAARTL